MGFDLVGIRNEDAYFRANIIVWPQLLNLCRSAGYITPDSWNYNFVVGLKTQEECDVLADMIESYLKSHNDISISIPSSAQKMFDVVRAAVNQWEGVHVSCSVAGSTITRGSVLQFVAFLRQCGGFDIG